MGRRYENFQSTEMTAWRKGLSGWKRTVMDILYDYRKELMDESMKTKDKYVWYQVLTVEETMRKIRNAMENLNEE